MRPEARACTLALCLASFQLLAQPASEKAAEVPLPAPLQPQGLIPLELRGTSLQFGVARDSISIGADGVVRYVLVARSASGAVNAMYEGLRCSTGEVIVHARHHPETGWIATGNEAWQKLQGNGAHRHSLLIARTGACQEHAPNRSAAQIAQDLQAPADRRYRSEVR